MKGSQFCFLVAIILLAHGMDEWAARVAGFLWALAALLAYIGERGK